MTEKLKLSEVVVISNFGEVTKDKKGNLILPYQTLPLGKRLVKHNQGIKNTILKIAKKVEELEKRIKKLEAKK